MLALNLAPLFTFGEVLRRLGDILRIDGEELARAGARVLGIWLLAWLAYRLVALAARRIEIAVDDGDDSVTTLRERRGQTISQLLRSVGRVVIIAIALLLTFNVFIDIGPILAGAGILGLAVSFGAQSLVKDVISGFFILFENQFAIGDVIEVGGQERAGGEDDPPGRPAPGRRRHHARRAQRRDQGGQQQDPRAGPARWWTSACPTTRTSTAPSRCCGTRRPSSPPTRPGAPSSTGRSRCWASSR